MKLNFKDNIVGYFNFYYQIVGSRFFIYLGLSTIISFLDGIGLAMFVPLLQAISAGEIEHSNAESLGQMRYIIYFLEGIGLNLTIGTVILILITLFVSKGILKYFQLRYYAGIRQFFIKKIRNTLINNLQGLSYSAFLKLDAGRIQNTLTTEVMRLFNSMTLYFSAAQMFVMLLTYIVLAFLASYQFAFLVSLGALLSNVIYRKIYRTTKNASNELSVRGADFNGFLIQSINYFKYLKSTNTFSVYGQKLKNVIHDAEKLNHKIGHYNAISNSLKEPLIVVIVSIVILIQVSWLNGNLGTIILSLLLFYRALGFLVNLQNYWQGFIENNGGITSVVEISQHMSALQEENGTKQFKSVDNGIQLANVDFYYGKMKVLDNISINIPSRKTVALVGESGSGKTTIANMIAGLFSPAKGDLFIDNVSIKDIDLNSYRQKIGYISQEPVIFNDTIFNNITFWAEPTLENKRRFEQVLKMTSLNHFIASQPEKENTRLGDNGILISGGQKQRISIARELYKEVEILIFDEATSALDSETEKVIQENIQKLHGCHTMVVIAHRLSTIKEADKIFLLEKGKVTAHGTFEEMINISTRFKKMVSLQAVS